MRAPSFLGVLQKRQQAADTRETVLSGLKLTGETLGQGIAEFLGNRQEMTAVVLGLSAAALGIYSAKMGTGIMGRYVEVCRGCFPRFLLRFFCSRCVCLSVESCGKGGAGLR